jgi:hypothetical protein
MARPLPFNRRIVPTFSQKNPPQSRSLPLRGALFRELAGIYYITTARFIRHYSLTVRMNKDPKGDAEAEGVPAVARREKDSKNQAGARATSSQSLFSEFSFVRYVEISAKRTMLFGHTRVFIHT